MAYNLRKRPIKVSNGGTLNLFWYAGPATAGDYSTLDLVDAQNFDWVKTFYEIDTIIATYETSFKIANVNVINDKKDRIAILYNDMIDIMFKYLNKLVFEVEPVAGDIGKDGLYEIKDGANPCKKLPGLLEDAVAMIFKPISTPLIEIANKIMDKRFPRAPSNLAVKQGMEAKENEIKTVTEQINVVSSKKPKPKNP